MTGRDIVYAIAIVASLLVWGMGFATIAYVIYCGKEIIMMDHAKRMRTKNNE